MRGRGGSNRATINSPRFFVIILALCLYREIREHLLSPCRFHFVGNKPFLNSFLLVLGSKYSRNEGGLLGIYGIFVVCGNLERRMKKKKRMIVLLWEDGLLVKRTRRCYTLRNGQVSYYSVLFCWLSPSFSEGGGKVTDNNNGNKKKRKEKIISIY